MKQLLLRIYLLPLLAALACGGSSQRQGKETKYKIPWPNSENSAYESQVIVLKTITDSHRLKGTAASVHFKPRSDEDMEKSTTTLRFIESGKVLIPADVATLQVTTVYAHHEKLQEMDHEVGVYADLRRPRKIGVSVYIGGEEGDLPETDNAIYLPQNDSILIVPYTLNDLPLTLNAGVLAHEYFHGLFQSIVYDHIKSDKLLLSKDKRKMKRKSNKKPTTSEFSASTFNSFVLRAMNEGLADYWAWVYLGDDNFLSFSLPKHSEARALGKAVTAFPDNEKLKKVLMELSEDKLLSMSYVLGTNYARFLRQLTLSVLGNNHRESRIEMARKITSALRSIGKEVAASFETKFLGPDFFVETLMKQETVIAERFCEEFAKVLPREERGTNRCKAK